MSRRPGDRGSVLMLVPAGVLVLFVLGAMAVDSAIAFLAQRELSAAAASLANDVATVALSEDRLYAGEAAIDEGRATEVVHEALGRRAPRGVGDLQTSVRAEGDQVCVTLTGRVAYVFSRAVPGAQREATVRGRAVATAVPQGATVRRSGVEC